MEGLLALSTADKAFMESILATVTDVKAQAKPGFVGSDAWVRQEFESYLASLLCAITDYGYQFTSMRGGDTHCQN